MNLPHRSGVWKRGDDINLRFINLDASIGYQMSQHNSLSHHEVALFKVKYHVCIYASHMHQMNLHTPWMDRLSGLHDWVTPFGLLDYRVGWSRKELVWPERLFWTETLEGNSQSKDKWQFLEERLKAIKGANCYGFEAIDLCFALDMVIQHKFKFPNFDKYKGNSCSRNHLVSYYRKMASHAHDGKLLIHFFQEILTGVALGWTNTNLEEPSRGLLKAIQVQQGYGLEPHTSVKHGEEGNDKRKEGEANIMASSSSYQVTNPNFCQLHKQQLSPNYFLNLSTTLATHISTSTKILTSSPSNNTSPKYSSSKAQC
ncbi:hypothetical protein CR513_58862, partial [Mucuna pruriens]